MKKLAPLAALLIAASGALAQSECQKACDEAKATAVKTVSTTADDCAAACESTKTAAVQQVAQKADDCAAACESTKTAAVQQVAQKTDDCAAACESAKTAAVQQVALTADDCQAACESAKTAAVQQVALTADDCQAACEKSCDESQTTGVQLVSFPADMPVMSYVVGDKTTRCSAEAGELASHCDTLKVKYQVVDAVYDCPTEATKAQTVALGSYLDRITRVSFVVGEECTQCPIQAREMASQCESLNVKYKVGNTVFACPEKAIAAAAMAYGMAHHVQTSYAVNGESTACSATFAKARECSETKASFVVNGKSTECEVEAGLLVATARVEAALAAASQVAGS